MVAGAGNVAAERAGRRPCPTTDGAPASGGLREEEAMDERVQRGGRAERGGERGGEGVNAGLGSKKLTEHGRSVLARPSEVEPRLRAQHKTHKPAATRRRLFPGLFNRGPVARYGATEPSELDSVLVPHSLNICCSSRLLDSSSLRMWRVFLAVVSSFVCEGYFEMISQISSRPASFA